MVLVELAGLERALGRVGLVELERALVLVEPAGLAWAWAWAWSKVGPGKGTLVGPVELGRVEPVGLVLALAQA